jgi:serine/threonine protein kinase
LQQETPSYAVKTLKQDDREAFNTEVENLKRFSKLNHPHLIDLLFTYHHKSSYNLVSPMAEGNLRAYWEKEREPLNRQSTLPWALNQLRGITEGLMAIHGYSGRYGPKDHQDSTQSPPMYGWHGDIKPENILWFRKPNGDHSVHGGSIGCFKIGDFGLAHFDRHGAHERPARHLPVGGTPAYGSPECSLKQSISSKYDIWSLGCVILEFTTWLLHGPEGVNHFAYARRKVSGNGDVSDDRFYDIEPNQNGTTGSAIIRQAVRDQISTLKSDCRCATSLQRVLSFLETRMLEVNPSKRADSPEVVRFFDSVIEDDPGGGSLSQDFNGDGWCCD